MWLTSRCQRKDELFRECKILFIFWLLRPDFFKGQNIEMSGHWIAKLYKFGQIYYKILGCRDPRCKHEYLDSPWFDRKVPWW